MALFTFFELKEFNSASLTAAYQNFGTALSRPCYDAEFHNASNVDVYISTDGTTDNIRLPAGETVSLVQGRKFSPSPEGVIIFKQGTQLEIKQVTSSGTGSIIANLLTLGSA